MKSVQLQTLVLWLGVLIGGVFNGAGASDLKTVPILDLDRYMGKWYEIARFPNSFQKDCDEAEAEYRKRDDGQISVVNSCRSQKDRTRREVEGRAWVVEAPSKWGVNFVPGWLRWTGIGTGKYWVIDLGRDYEYAVVSEPNRKYLWILARTPTVDPGLYEGILNRLRQNGFDLNQVSHPLIPAR